MKLLTTSQAAEMLAISVPTLRALVRAGELAFIPKGLGSERRHMVFDQADIDDYVKRSKTRLVPDSEPIRGPATDNGFLAQRKARLAAKAAARKAAR
ncbi:helix-turn-helix domain-containing protein [Rhizobium sp. NLR22b]|uniref:helix-turn-helix domain-containing protein n=1 Tax=Rhizobium sp. NLR22b TaxID=2731115 RepID=UPI001C82E555|nr:helix-turn-helix domain-containing protein [Rhizobium sp. NLR22b]